MKQPREDKKIKEGKSQQKKRLKFVCLFERERELCFVVGRNGRRESVSLEEEKKKY